MPTGAMGDQPSASDEAGNAALDRPRPLSAQRRHPNLRRIGLQALLIDVPSDPRSYDMGERVQFIVRPNSIKPSIAGGVKILKIPRIDICSSPGVGSRVLPPS